MKKITLLVLAFFCINIIAAQKKQSPEYNDVKVKYVGSNNNTYYFKHIDDGKILSFNKLEELASNKIKSGLSLKDNILLLKVKTSFIVKEVSDNESEGTNITTHEKQFSLEDINIFLEKKNQSIDDGEVDG